MNDILEFLPTEVKTSFLIGILVIGWRIYVLVKKSIDKKKQDKKALEIEILDKERARSKVESRLKNVEEDVDSLKKAFKEKNEENREDFKILSKKIDRVLEILIKPLK